MTLSTNNHGTSYVEWSSVIAGTVLAAAISFIFLQFGSGLGLAASKEWAGEPDKVRWTLILTGLWLIWVQVSASLAGGYVAGRMRRPLADATPHESEIRDGLHGLLVWASGTALAILGVAFASLLAALAPHHADMAQGEMAANVTAHFAKTAGIIAGFGVLATSLISAVAAYWAGTCGGDHRDQNTDLSRYVSFRNTKR